MTLYLLQHISVLSKETIRRCIMINNRDYILLWFFDFFFAVLQTLSTTIVVHNICSEHLHGTDLSLWKNIPSLSLLHQTFASFLFRSVVFSLLFESKKTPIEWHINTSMLKQDLTTSGRTKQDMNKIIDEINSESLEFACLIVEVFYQYWEKNQYSQMNHQACLFYAKSFQV